MPGNLVFFYLVKERTFLTPQDSLTIKTLTLCDKLIVFDILLTHSNSIFFLQMGQGRYVVLVSLQEPRYIRHSSPNLNHKIAELCRERGGGRTIDAAALTPPDAKNLNKSRRPRGEECLRRNCIRSPAPTLCMRCVQLSQAVADTAGSWSLHI